MRRKKYTNSDDQYRGGVTGQRGPRTLKKVANDKFSSRITWTTTFHIVLSGWSDENSAAAPPDGGRFSFFFYVMLPVNGKIICKRKFS